MQAKQTLFNMLRKNRNKKLSKTTVILVTVTKLNEADSKAESEEMFSFPIALVPQKTGPKIGFEYEMSLFDDSQCKLEGFEWLSDKAGFQPQL